MMAAIDALKGGEDLCLVAGVEQQSTASARDGVACFLPDYPKLRNFVRKMGENHGRFVQNPTFFEKEKCLKSDFQGVSLKFRHVSNQIPRILN